MFSTHHHRLPEPEQVAARALGLCCLVCRSSLEDPTAGSGAEGMHCVLMRWAREAGVEKGLQSDELSILERPPGGLSMADAALAAWRVEQLTVLAWALGKIDLPRAAERYEPTWVAKKIGFLGEGGKRFVRQATLRSPGDLLQYSVIIADVCAQLERDWKAAPAEDIALALCVATERQEAAAWLVGERELQLESGVPALSLS